MEDRIVMPLGKNKMAVLVVEAFDGDVDIERILKIDYANLLGEILTFPVVFNRIANMKAEMGNIVAENKLDLDIFEAQLYEEHRGRLAASSDKTKGPSIKDVESSVMRDPKLSLKKKSFYTMQKNFEYLDSLYWSAKSKDQKLNVLSEKITPEEFEKELVEGSINGVMIKMKNKAIKG
jgi:hypothetical protein